MSVEKHLSSYYNTLSCSTETIKQKKKMLEQFCRYTEQSLALNPGAWNFDTVCEYKYGEKTIWLPVDASIVARYLSTIKNVNGRTYNDTLRTIRHFFDHLVTIEVLDENPARYIEQRKLSPPDTSSMRVSLEEGVLLLIGSLLYNEHRNRNFCLVMLLLATATRIGEALTMTVEDLKFEKDLIFVDGKSNKRRRFLTPGLSESFVELLNDPLRLDALKGQNYVFYSDEGGPLTTKKANKLLKGFAATVGITKNISTYYLRRGFATILANSNFSLREIQVIFDHDRIKNTEAYIHELKSKLLDEMTNKSPLELRLENLMRSAFKVVYPNCNW